MQSIWIIGFVVLFACGISNSIPVPDSEADQLNKNNDPETRLIVPLEMSPSYFEIMKNKSDASFLSSTKAEKTESIPLNFLRSSDDSDKKEISMLQKPLMAFDGSKAPIFITIPIYITSDREGMPLITTSIEQIVPAKNQSKNSLKKEDQKPEALISIMPSEEKEATTTVIAN